jgi:hypothetical protein
VPVELKATSVVRPMPSPVTEARLDTTYGIVTATLDGVAPVTLDCYYPAATTSQTRRLLFSGIGSVTIAATNRRLGPPRHRPD